MTTESKPWEIWGASWWDALSAFGTVGAVVVALLLAGVETARRRGAEAELSQTRDRERTEQLRQQARLVTAWVERRFTPADDGTHYVPEVQLHVSNESNGPVTKVFVDVGLGDPVVRVGPLGAPSPLPVLPARSHRSWEISLALMAFSSPVGPIADDPVASLTFTDAQGSTWVRGFDGDLNMRDSYTRSLLDDDPDLQSQQLGSVDTPFNPQAVVLAFLAGLHELAEGKCNETDHPRLLVAPTAEGFVGLTEGKWVQLAETVRGYGMASHVWYPAPRVAYTRLIHDDDAPTQVEAGQGVHVRAQVVTSVFIAGQGWRIFSVGPAATAPDWIRFPGDLNSDLRGEDEADTTDLGWRRWFGG